MLKRMKGKSGVTPILGTMMLLLIILTMVATVLWWGTPTIRAIEVETQYTSAKGYMENLNREVKDLMMDGWGCSREFKVSIPSGEIQMYQDTNPFIEKEEVVKQGDFQPTTVWMISYNMPNSQYDILFDDITDDTPDKFSLRRLDSALPLGPCEVEVMCLKGELAGESSKTGLSITASGTSVAISLYDECRITIRDSTTEVVAEAYVFSLAPIAYRYPTEFGTFHIIQQNTGLTSNYPDTEAVIQPFFTSEASLSGSEKTLTLYMATFKPLGIYKTGSGEYTFGMRYSDAGYYGNMYVKDLRINVGGDYQQAWVNSFSSRFQRYHQSSSTYTGFIRDTTQSPDFGVIYNTPSSMFANHQNLVMVNIIWAGVDVKIGS